MEEGECERMTNKMTNEEAIAWLEHHFDPLPDGTKQSEAVSLAIKALKQETNIKSLGEDLRIFQKSIKDDKVLIGFNMAVAICNKYFAGSEVQE